MRLDGKDILQVNVTVIAGLLIFLTVSTISMSAKDKVPIATSTYLALGGLMLFSLSSMLILIGGGERYVREARGVTVAGFGYILVAALYYSWILYANSGYRLS